MHFRYVEADITTVLRVFKARQDGPGMMTARGTSPHQAIIVARERG